MPKIFSKKYTYFWVISIFLTMLLVVGIVIFRQSQAKKNRKMSSLKEIVIQPTRKHSASMIFLHGLGDNAENQRIICQPLAENFPHIRFIIPQAPIISVSMNGGLPMPAWYNIKGDPHDIMSLKEDKPGLLNSTSQIKKIIQEEVNSGIPPQKIMVVGHSQGASVALAVGLTSDYRLAGIIGLSAFLPCRNEIFNYAKPENKIIPFFLYHNQHDNIIPVYIGDQSAKLLKEKGYQIEFKNEYIGSHFFQPEELQKILSEKLKELIY